MDSTEPESHRRESHVLFDRQQSVEESYLLQLFDNLDRHDGIQDGQICCKFLLKYLDNLNLQSQLEFEIELALNRRQIKKIISEADHNKNGFIDKEEFLKLSMKEVESKHEKSLFRQYFEVLAYAEHYYFWPPPLFIITITIFQIIFFAMHFAHHENKSVPECSYFTFIGQLRRECWRFVTYIFVHLDHWHMIFNMLMQIIIGIPLEMSHGTIRVALLYLSGVFAASLTFSLAQPGLNLAGKYSHFDQRRSYTKLLRCSQS